MNKDKIKSKFLYCFNQLKEIIIDKYFYQYLKNIKYKNNQIINSSKPFIRRDYILCEYFPTIYFKNDHFNKLKDYDILIYTGNKKTFIDNLNNFLYNKSFYYNDNQIDFYMNIINLLISKISSNQEISFNEQEYLSRNKHDKDFEIKTNNYYLYKNVNIFKLNFDILNYNVDIDFYEEKININKLTNIKLNSLYKLIDVTDFLSSKFNKDKDKKFILVKVDNQSHLDFVDKLCLSIHKQIINLANSDKPFLELRIKYLKDKEIELLNILKDNTIWIRNY